MYKIIGADQKEYGPITADQMRQWIVEGRVNAQTLVWSETTGNWKPLTTYPELSATIPGYVPGAIPPSVPAYSSGGDHSDALQKVKGPAIGLMVIAGFGLLTAIGGVVASLFGITMGGAGMDEMKDIPEMAPFLGILNSLGVAQGIVHIIFSILIFFGANKMRKLESYGFALATAILAVIPCLSPCCLGIPVGIWAIVILNKPEVKSHFNK